MDFFIIRKIMDKELLLKYIEQFGNSASIGILHPESKFFKSKNVDGIVGYRIENNHTIVIGDPLADNSNKIEVIKEFISFFDDNKKSKKDRIIFVLISSDFSNELALHFNYSFIQFGHDISILNNLDLRSLKGTNARLLKKKYRRAIKDGLSFHEYKDYDLSIEKSFINLLNKWYKDNQGGRFYLSPLQPFAYKENKRYFYVTVNNILVGFITLNKMNGLKGFVINGLVLDKDAPKSSSEFIILNLLDTIRLEDNNILYVGPLLSSKIDKFHNIIFLYKFLINFLFFIIRNIFNMNYKQLYWDKFSPSKTGSYIVFQRSYISLSEIISLLRFFHFK